MLPFGTGPATNGEFVPDAPSAHDRDVAAATLAEIEWAAQRSAIDRRAFLRGAGGVAAALTVFNLAACSGGSRRAATTAASTTVPPTSAPGGTYTVPTTADLPACQHALAGDEFIFDVHSHHVVPQGPWRHTAPATVGLVAGMLPQCAAADPFDCADRAAYLHDMFLASDTTVAMLTDGVVVLHRQSHRVHDRVATGARRIVTMCLEAFPDGCLDVLGILEFGKVHISGRRGDLLTEQ